MKSRLRYQLVMLIEGSPINTNTNVHTPWNTPICTCKRFSLHGSVLQRSLNGLEHCARFAILLVHIYLVREREIDTINWYWNKSVFRDFILFWDFALQTNPINDNVYNFFFPRNYSYNYFRNKGRVLNLAKEFFCQLSRQLLCNF